MGDHLNNKLSMMLEEISAEKEFKPADEMEPAEEINPVDDFEAFRAAENEVAAHMEEVIERAKNTDGWDIEDVLRKVDVGVSKILDDHAIGDAAKENAMDHLNNKLSMMLEEISANKEFEPADEMELAEEINPVEDFEAFQAAETEVAANMDAVIKRAKAVDGWDIDDVFRKVDETRVPTNLPSKVPTNLPSKVPTNLPSVVPSGAPSLM